VLVTGDQVELPVKLSALYDAPGGPAWLGYSGRTPADNPSNGGRSSAHADAADHPPVVDALFAVHVARKMRLDPSPLLIA